MICDIHSLFATYIHTLFTTNYVTSIQCVRFAWRSLSITHAQGNVCSDLILSTFFPFFFCFVQVSCSSADTSPVHCGRGSVSPPVAHSPLNPGLSHHHTTVTLNNGHYNSHHRQHIAVQATQWKKDRGSILKWICLHVLYACVYLHLSIERFSV